MVDTGSLVVPLPVTGLAIYIKRCCEDKFCSFTESYGISVFDLKTPNEGLLIKYYKPTPSYNEDNLRTLVLQFSRSILTSYSVRYINLIIPLNMFTSVQSQVERYSLKKKTVIYCNQLDAHFLCGVGDCDNEVLEFLGTFLKSDARPAMSCGLPQDEKSTSFFSEPLLNRSGETASLACHPTPHLNVVNPLNDEYCKPYRQVYVPPGTSLLSSSTASTSQILNCSSTSLIPSLPNSLSSPPTSVTAERSVSTKMAPTAAPVSTSINSPNSRSMHYPGLRDGNSDRFSVSESMHSSKMRPDDSTRQTSVMGYPDSLNRGFNGIENEDQFTSTSILSRPGRSSLYPFPSLEPITSYDDDSQAYGEFGDDFSSAGSMPYLNSLSNRVPTPHSRNLIPPPATSKIPPSSFTPASIPTATTTTSVLAPVISAAASKIAGTEASSSSSSIHMQTSILRSGEEMDRVVTREQSALSNTSLFFLSSSSTPSVVSTIYGSSISDVPESTDTSTMDSFSTTALPQLGQVSYSLTNSEQTSIRNNYDHMKKAINAYVDKYDMMNNKTPTHPTPPPPATVATARPSFPPFSFVSPVYTIRENIFCGRMPSPLYRQPLIRCSNSTALTFGSNHYLSDAIIITQYHHIFQWCKEMSYTIMGAYYNQNGWYILFPDNNSPHNNPSFLDPIFRRLTEQVFYPTFRQLSLQTSVQSFMSFLTYVTEVTNGQLSAHRPNADSVTVIGADPLLSDFICHLENQGLLPHYSMNENSFSDSDDPEEDLIQYDEILKRYEDALQPTQDVTCSELQGVWANAYVARLLENTPLGFDCFLSRCYRSQLMRELERMMSIPSAYFKTIIRCKTGYYVVIDKTGAPTRERWKRYKTRIKPELLDVQFLCVPIKQLKKMSVESLRTQVEAITSNVTLFCDCNKRIYLVGIPENVSRAKEMLVDVIATDCSTK